MQWMHQRIAVIFLAVAVGILVTVVMLQSPARKTKIAEARLRALLAEWQLALPIPYRQEPINYGRASSAREGTIEYFKWKIVKAEFETILADQHLAKRLEFRRKAEFYNSPSKPWWSAAPGATCFWGTMDSNDMKSSITLYLVVESENYWIFIESLSGI
jgi:hypothetical protein